MTIDITQKIKISKYRLSKANVRTNKNIVKNNPSSVNHRFYGQWVSGYITDEYAEENRKLISILEKLTKNYTDDQINHLIDIFTACSRYELCFWDMAWNMNK